MSSQGIDRELLFTGERVVPGKTPPFLVLEHLVRYRFAAQFVDDHKVLDIGCGTGYGDAILAEKAKLVVGVDTAREAIEYAQENYHCTNFYCAVADCRALPFPSRVFDVAVLFEVIEHTVEQGRFLSEIRRVLSPDGVLILSTPSPAGPTKAIEEPNPFHYKELTEYELLELLRPHFSYVQLLYQHELSASGIQASATARMGEAEVVENFSFPTAAKYLVAVCGARPLRVRETKVLGLGGIEHQIAIVQDLRQTQKELAARAQQLSELVREIDALVRQREENQHEYAKDLAAHKEVITRLENRLRVEITIRDQQLGELKRQSTSQGMELAWLYRWLPINRLAHKLLYGRNLRRRFLRRLGLRA